MEHQNNLEQLEKFNKALSVAPKKEAVKINKFADNSKYVPISYLETKLDELFFGLWSTENEKTVIIANEILVSIELKVFHPVAQVWLTRIGTGAAQVRLQRGATPAQALEKKITNACVQDYPHAKAEAFKNACKSLGALFGRDLNREYAEKYQPILEKSAKKEELLLSIQQASSVQDLAVLWAKNQDVVDDDVKVLFTSKKRDLQDETFG